MDKLVDDGCTMNANSAGGHLRWSVCAMLFYPRFLIVPRLIPVEDPA